MKCDDSNSAGCSHCAPQPSTTCCDLCDPDVSLAIRTVQPPATKKRMKKSHIKPYMRSTADHGLRVALRDWRDTVAVEQFGRAVVKDFGADIFMPTDTISRIVNCAHAGKLHCLADLKKEISWSNSWLDEHGETIIDKIHAWFPPPMSNKGISVPLGSRGNLANTISSVSNPLANTTPSASTPGAPGQRPRKLPRCGSCKAVGHTSMCTYFNLISLS